MKRFTILLRHRISRPLRASALALVMSLTGACIAHGQMRGNFDDADTNHDGHVTFDEFQAYATARLAASNAPRARKFKDLSPEQQTAMLHRRFNKLDKDQKGYLERSDWKRS